MIVHWSVECDSQLTVRSSSQTNTSALSALMFAVNLGVCREIVLLDRHFPVIVFSTIGQFMLPSSSESGICGKGTSSSSELRALTSEGSQHNTEQCLPVVVVGLVA